MPRPIALFRSPPSRQKGVVATMIALVVLVITLLAVMALMRSVDTANSVAGTLAFRQAVLQEAERAYSEARAIPSIYLSPGSDKSNASIGYYASVQAASSDRPDIPAVLYNKTSDAFATLKTGAVNSGNVVTYVVERMCPNDGVATLTTCIVPGKAITGGTTSNTTTDPGIPFNTTGTAAAFRLTVRVDGPKNSIAYVQTMLR